MDESSGGSGSPRSDKFAVSKVGLLTAVHKVRSAVTHGNRGFRQAFKFKKAAEETLQEHDIRGCHSAFLTLLKNIAKERYCRANRESPNNVINDVLTRFFFLEKDMHKAGTYAGPILHRRRADGQASTQYGSCRSEETSVKRLPVVHSIAICGRFHIGSFPA